MNAQRIVAALFWVLSFAGLASAELVPARDIKQLVSDADTIVLGKIEDLSDLGIATIKGRVGGSGARLVTGRIAVHRVLKGTADENIAFWSPVWLPAMGGLALKQHALIFLKQRDGNTEFVSPYDPVLATVGFPRVTASEPFEAVVQAIASALLAPGASAEMRRRAVYQLKDIETPPAPTALRAAFHDRDRWVQGEAAAALLRINDIEALPYAEAELLRSPTGTSGVLSNLRVGLRGLKSPVAIPSLARLLARGDVETRRVAAEVMGQIDSRETLRPLGLALDDPDEEVRLSAVRALASVTKLEQLISLEGFRADESRRIAEWKQRLAKLGVDLR